MKNLELVDNSGGSSETDVLIGADLYWLLVDSEVNKKGCSELVAISLKFGWLVSGPFPRICSEDGFMKSCLSTTHVLCLQNFS